MSNYLTKFWSVLTFLMRFPKEFNKKEKTKIEIKGIWYIYTLQKKLQNLIITLLVLKPQYLFYVLYTCRYFIIGSVRNKILVYAFCWKFTLNKYCSLSLIWWLRERVDMCFILILKTDIHMLALHVHVHNLKGMFSCSIWDKRKSSTIQVNILKKFFTTEFYKVCIQENINSKFIYNPLGFFF